MDPIRNPYVPGAGSPPIELAGREDIIGDAEILLSRIAIGRAAQSSILVGLRGVGKTVLLRNIEGIAENKGYATIFIESHDQKSLPAQIIPLLREKLYKISRIERAREYALRALRVLKGFASSLRVEIEGVTYGMSIEPEPGVADSGDLESDLPRLMEIIAAAGKAAEIPIAVLVDEIQYLTKKEFSALIMGIHRINQAQLPLTLIAAGLPQTLQLAGNSKSYSERLFSFPEIGPLDNVDATKALQEPARQEGVKFEHSAIDEILEQTEGYPYFLQQWGFIAWNIANDNIIRKSDIAMTNIKAIESLDNSFFKVRFDRCTPSEKRYMRALSELGPGKQRSGEIAEVLGLKATSVGLTRSNLIKKGMLYAPAYGDTAFTVPHFDEFMKRIMPTLERG